MLVTTNAIVISSIKFSEADLIVKCFTEKSGLKTYLLRNILKSKKGKLKTSMFQPLTQLEIVANHKDKGAMENMREAKVLNAYQTFHTNIFKSSILIFLSEIIKNAVKEEETNKELFSFLKNSFDWLDANEEISNFHLIFMLKFTRHLGFYPEATNNHLPFFNLMDGTFQEIETNGYCISNDNVEILKQLLETDFQNQKTLKLNQQKRSNFINVMLVYYDLHLQNFRKPKSLSVLNEIFT